MVDRYKAQEMRGTLSNILNEGTNTKNLWKNAGPQLRGILDAVASGAPHEKNETARVSHALSKFNR